MCSHLEMASLNAGKKKHPATSASSCFIPMDFPVNSPCFSMVFSHGFSSGEFFGEIQGVLGVNFTSELRSMVTPRSCSSMRCFANMSRLSREATGWWINEKLTKNGEIRWIDGLYN